MTNKIGCGCKSKQLKKREKSPTFGMLWKTGTNHPKTTAASPMTELEQELKSSKTRLETIHFQLQTAIAAKSKPFPSVHLSG
mmetsp:Transcript_72/g.127  ORF Transcript_72/g.127 Transcript_72/m.127 type:complete len:82 (-) Transcript_72:182-427(-)